MILGHIPETVRSLLGVSGRVGAHEGQVSLRRSEIIPQCYEGLVERRRGRCHLGIREGTLVIALKASANG